MALRGSCEDIIFPHQVTTGATAQEAWKELSPYIFDADLEKIPRAPFTVITPDSNNPYQQMDVAN